MTLTGWTLDTIDAIPARQIDELLMCDDVVADVREELTEEVRRRSER